MMFRCLPSAEKRVGEKAGERVARHNERDNNKNE